MPLVLVLERYGDQPPLWFHAVLWLPLSVVLALTLLPRIKGAVIALLWAHRIAAPKPSTGRSGPFTLTPAGRPMTACATLLSLLGVLGAGHPFSERRAVACDSGPARRLPGRLLCDPTERRRTAATRSPAAAADVSVERVVLQAYRAIGDRHLNEPDFRKMSQETYKGFASADPALSLETRRQAPSPSARRPRGA